MSQTLSDASAPGANASGLAVNLAVTGGFGLGWPERRRVKASAAYSVSLANL
jgi:hypothetical protein